MPESAKEGTRGLSEGSDIGLGCGSRAFESRHSDQSPLKSVDFRGLFFDRVRFFIYACRWFRVGSKPTFCLFYAAQILNGFLSKITNLVSSCLPGSYS